MAKSCKDCPSFLNKDDAQLFFGRQIGVPVCATRGIPLDARNGVKSEGIWSTLAEGCDKYLADPPPSPTWSNYTFQVAMPDIEALRFNRRNRQDVVRSCGSCEHFVTERTVAGEFGFAAGLCATKGKLILGNRATYEARGCPDRSFFEGSPSESRRDLSNIMLIPLYSLDGPAPMSTDPSEYHKQIVQEWSEPSTYETDKEVSSSDAAAGIRAWRRVADPVSKNETYLPIYRRDFFSEDEASKIPRTGDDEHPEDYIDHGFFVYKISVLWTELDETPGVWGGAGTGKTELFRHLAWLMQLPFERISITGSTELDDLAGKMLFNKEKGTYWQDGRVVQAWSKPCVMVVDEPNVGPPDVWQFLRPMTDNSKQLVIDQNAGERRTRHDDCYLGLAMNPAWDTKNVGTHLVGDADVNRLMHLSVPLPPVELEREIISTRCKHDGYEIEADKLDTIMKIATDIRALCDNDALPISWAVRPQIKVARASKWFDLKMCYRMAVADFLEPESCQMVLDVVDTHV